MRSGPSRVKSWQLTHARAAAREAMWIGYETTGRLNDAERDMNAMTHFFCARLATAFLIAARLIWPN